MKAFILNMYPQNAYDIETELKQDSQNQDIPDPTCIHFPPQVSPLSSKPMRG